jgi:hypothetical protein
MLAKREAEVKGVALKEKIANLRAQLAAAEQQLVEEEKNPLLIEESLKLSLAHTEQTAAERSIERKELRDHHGKKRKATALQAERDDAKCAAKAMDNTTAKNARVQVATDGPKLGHKQAYTPVCINPTNNNKIMTLSTVYHAMMVRDGKVPPAANQRAILAWIAENCRFMDGREFSQVRGYEGQVQAKLKHCLGPHIANAWRIIPTTGQGRKGKKSLTFSADAKNWLKSWLKDNHNMFTSGIWTQKGVESQQAMLDKLFTDLRKDSAAAKAMMDSHPDERRAQEALDLKEVHVQITTGVNMDVKNSLRRRVAVFLRNQHYHTRYVK